MVTVAEARAAARTRYDREARVWAAQGAQSPTLEIVLHPPSEAVALRDTTAAIAWVTSWRSLPFDAEVVWEDRRWASLGRQSIPVRCIIRGPARIAVAAGSHSHWSTLSARETSLRDRWLNDSNSEPLLASLQTEAARIGALEADDFERFCGVLEWIASHPASGLFARQLPIRGVDTKWIECHARLVRSFVEAVTGSPDLGLSQNPSLVRVRFLDPLLRPGGLTDLAAPAEILRGLEIEPTVVLVFENLMSVLAMPPLPGAVAVHGSGYAVDRLRDIPWAQDGRIVYWGDLDSHGFAILNQARHSCSDVTSVLMDDRTLDDHRDLAGVEPTPHRGRFERLTTAEQSMLARLRAEGDVRLEQERIAWTYAMGVLRDVVAARS